MWCAAGIAKLNGTVSIYLFIPGALPPSLIHIIHPVRKGGKWREGGKGEERVTDRRGVAGGREGERGGGPGWGSARRRGAPGSGTGGAGRRRRRRRVLPSAPLPP